MNRDLLELAGAFCLGMVAAGLLLGAAAPPPPRDLELLDRTLTMAERCATTTDLALRALLPRNPNTPTPPLAGP